MKARHQIRGLNISLQVRATHGVLSQDSSPTLLEAAFRAILQAAMHCRHAFVLEATVFLDLRTTEKIIRLILITGISVMVIV